MTTQELEQVIREYILDIYKKEYIGKIKIEKLDPMGYCIYLGLSMIERPLVIYAELDDKQFLKFLRKELTDKRFNMIHYGNLQLIYQTNCSPINKSCNCYDKG